VQQRQKKKAGKKIELSEKPGHVFCIIMQNYIATQDPFTQGSSTSI